jgi:hypothetical protein
MPSDVAGVCTKLTVDNCPTPWEAVDNNAANDIKRAMICQLLWRQPEVCQLIVVAKSQIGNPFKQLLRTLRLGFERRLPPADCLLPTQYGCACRHRIRPAYFLDFGRFFSVSSFSISFLSSTLRSRNSLIFSMFMFVRISPNSLIFTSKPESSW